MADLVAALIGLLCSGGGYFTIVVRRSYFVNGLHEYRTFWCFN